MFVGVAKGDLRVPLISYLTLIKMIFQLWMTNNFWVVIGETRPGDEADIPRPNDTNLTQMDPEK